MLERGVEVLALLGDLAAQPIELDLPSDGPGGETLERRLRQRRDLLRLGRPLETGEYGHPRSQGIGSGHGVAGQLGEVGRAIE